MVTNKKPTAQDNNSIAKKAIDAQTRARILKGTMADSNKDAKVAARLQEESLVEGVNFAKTGIGVNKASLSTKGMVLNHFNRLKNFEGVDFATSGIGYVFFTPPDLNLVKHRAGRSDLYGFIEYLGMTPEGRAILGYLDSNAYTGTKSANDSKVSGRIFMALLTNMSKGFETKDTSLDVSNRETFMGYRTSLPTDYTDSISTDSFTINYYDTRDLYVLKLHKLWVDYIHNVRKGHYIPKEQYIKTRIIDYMSSMYFIVVAEDGMEIKYWAKYTGVYPVNIPYSSMSWHGFENATIKELSITYNYNFKEDMDVSCLIDFAKYASASNGSSGTVDNNAIRSQYARGNQIMKDMWALGVGIASKNGKYYLIFDKDQVGLKQSNVKFQNEIAKGDLRYDNA